jgi:hypothetical protein
MYLDEILGRVKDSDLEHFKEKLTKMEEEQELRLHSLNLETIDDFAKRKYLNQIKDIEDLYIDATPLAENKTVPEAGEQNSDTLYQEFLKKLRG